MPKVSVIIPSYNRKAYIQESIESVRKQSCQDFEIIVVDDGSTDGTLDLLRAYGDAISLIEQKHAERAAARNKGIEQSKGDYIAFLDSDDVWLPDKLALQVEIMERSPHIVCVYGACLRMDAKSQSLPTARRQTRGFSGDIFLKLLKRNFIPSPTPLVRRSCFEKGIRFKPRHIPYEDWGCWLQIALQGDFCFIPQTLASYRVHAKQSVKLARAELIEEASLSVLEDSFELRPIAKKHKEEALGLAYLRCAYWYLLSGQSPKVQERLKRAFRHYPFFVCDPRWLGLGIAANFPILQKLIDIEGLHGRA